VLALSHGSRLTLERLGIWPQLQATPIETIHISQQGRLGRSLLTAADYGLPAMGYVVAAGDLAAALDDALAAAGIPIQGDSPVRPRRRRRRRHPQPRRRHAGGPSGGLRRRQHPGHDAPSLSSATTPSTR
jgi:2-polyprenyl-6-methoxyphenol hydroxylase-like FAD-dependent oxidoreductase